VGVEDVYLLILHEPYQSADHPVPIDATIMHALTLLHRAVPQPDGGRMYRCLTEFPSRAPGCVVPLSTLTFELDGGSLWPQVADWEAITAAVVALTKDKACDAIPLGLPPVMSALLAGGPATTLTLTGPDGRSTVRGGRERDEHLAELASVVRGFVAQGPFFPGDNLTAPPHIPAVMPHKPYRYRS
jgi:hypothetical protein